MPAGTLGRTEASFLLRGIGLYRNSSKSYMNQRNVARGGLDSPLALPYRIFSSFQEDARPICHLIVIVSSLCSAALNELTGYFCAQAGKAMAVRDVCRIVFLFRHSAIRCCVRSIILIGPRNGGV
jgi:hypothetical protein